MRYLPKNKPDANLLVGLDHSDDASVYQITDNLAIIQSVDFFTPVVDDPYTFGQIAAANALSDIYAMGGEPKTALNIVGFPINTLKPEILAKILQGAADKVTEAGAVTTGGHSVDDREPKFGLSVMGTVHPKKFYKNIGAKPGDLLVLTKPLGVGILTTAIKRNLLTKEEITELSELMSTLNKYAAETLREFTVHAVTDVTGFGLLGHAYEMASGSEVSFVINYEDVPVLPKAKQLAAESVFPSGAWKNHEWLQESVSYDSKLAKYEQAILCDAITSGGLLISLPSEEASHYLEKLAKNHQITAAIIGEVTNELEKTIYVK